MANYLKISGATIMAAFGFTILGNLYDHVPENRRVNTPDISRTTERVSGMFSRDKETISRNVETSRDLEDKVFRYAGKFASEGSTNHLYIVRGESVVSDLSPDEFDHKAYLN